MKTDILDYELPAELIAQQPLAVRSESRLLVFDRGNGKIVDTQFGKVGDYLRAGDCLVLNDTKVLAARFFARRRTGAKLEGLFLGQRPDGAWEVMLKGSRKVKIGEMVYLDVKGQKGKGISAVLIEKGDEGRCLLAVEGDTEEVLDRIGYPPLPPYIRRGADIRQAEIDRERYQTVYASHGGAVAAPTAGLHFTDELIGKLQEKGVSVAYVTLHVGEGTFKPVTADTMEQHEIHREWYRIDEKNARLINEAKKKGGKVVAVGTTSVRVLETVFREGEFTSGRGHTQLYILPGYRFRAVDVMITNFHLPKSTLLGLVCAFGGLKEVLDLYGHAVREKYRFYSYGDAMLII